MNSESTPDSQVQNRQDAGPAPGPARRASALLFLPRSVPWIVLALSLAAATGGWFAAWKHAELGARKRFDEEANRIARALGERMMIYQDVLHGAVGLYAASVTVERAEWKSYVESVSIEKRFPGIDGLGFIASVPREELDQFIKVTRADQTPEFQVRNPGTNSPLLVAKYIEPQARHAAVLGQDLGTDPELRAVAERACDTGEAALSGVVTLADGGGRQPGLVMLLPVYQNRQPHGTLEQRRANITGWVYARFITAQLMRGILGDKVLTTRFEALDATDAGEPTTFFAQAALPGGYAPKFSQEIPCEVGGRKWVLAFATRPAFDQTIPKGMPALAAAGGIVLSFLLFGIAWALSKTRERALAIASEMTAAHRETNLRLDHERYLLQTLMDNLPDRIYFKDNQSRFLRNSQAHLRAFGLQDPSQAIGKTDFDFFSKEHAQQAFEDEQQLMRSGQTLTKEEKETWPDGTVTWALSTKLPLRDERGKVVGTFGISRDITDRKRAEAALQEITALQQGILNSANYAIISTTTAGVVTTLNATAEKMLGYTAAEIVGKVTPALWHDAEEVARRAEVLTQELGHRVEPGFEAFVAKARLGGADENEWTFIRKDGTRIPVSLSVTALRDQAGSLTGFLGVIADITDRKRAEEAMRRAKELAEEASRTKSQFLANMSHELRTPLNSIIGFASILLKNKGGNLTAAELNFLDRIYANGKHLLGLINEILDLSKIEAHKVELQISPVMLDQLVRETVAQQEGLVRDRPVQLRAELPGRSLPLLTDSEKLQQVIINLIGNALKFTESGSVTVRVVTDAETHQPLRLEVSDTGIGIPADKLGVIFEAFHQAEAGTARKYGGTGLGLTISQALCQLMGFHIQVASEVGHGSTFSVVFQPSAPSSGRGPVVPAAPVLPPAPAAPETPGAARRSRVDTRVVLVIDDELDSRTLLSHMIEEAGCRAITADSGEMGLRMAREFAPDVITVDLLMPGMSGWEVVRALKTDPHLRGIPVIVISVIAAENRGRIFGSVEILQKPVDRDELVATLKRSFLPAKPRVLVVDDEEDARQLATLCLADLTSEVSTAANGKEALELMENAVPDAILLDLMMPVMDGMAFLNVLRADPRYQHIPVVVITAKELSPAETQMLHQETLDIVKKAGLFEADLKRLLEKLFKRSEERSP